jgi:hypothetical protein
VSLLDSGWEPVEVYPQREFTDDEGNHLFGPAEHPTPVRAHVQPVSSTEDTTVGQAVETRYRVIARDAPAGPWSHIVWRGQRYEVVAEPAVWPSPPHLRHTTVIVRRTGWPRSTPTPTP